MRFRAKTVGSTVQHAQVQDRRISLTHYVAFVVRKFLPHGVASQHRSLDDCSGHPVSSRFGNRRGSKVRTQPEFNCRGARELADGVPARVEPSRWKADFVVFVMVVNKLGRLDALHKD